MAETNEYPRREEAFQPTKEFYLVNPRSKEIREVSLAITSDIEALLHDPDTAVNQEKQQVLYARLEAHNGDLIKLGIEPHMHENRPIDFYRKSPVRAAEYLAGQLYGLTGRKIPSEKNTNTIAREFSTEESHMPVIAKAGGMPPKVYDFMAVRGTVNIVNGLFDAEPPQ